MAKRTKKQTGGFEDRDFAGSVNPDDLREAQMEQRKINTAAGGANTVAGGSGTDTVAGGSGTDPVVDPNLEAAFQYAQSGADNLSIARYIRDNNVNLNDLAGKLGVDSGVANKMFSALTDEPTARVVEFQQNNPNASNTELARFIRDTGADVNLVADALDIDRDTATQMYQDALGSEFETAKVAETKVAGVTDDTPGTYTPPVVSVEDYVTRPTTAAVDTSTAITEENAVQKLNEFVDIPAPKNVTAAQIEVAVANVKTGITSGQVDASQYEAALASELNRTVPAIGNQRPPITIDELRDLSSRATAAQMGDTTSGMAQTAQFTINPDSFVPGVTAADIRVSATPEIEAQQRQALTTTSMTGVEARITDSVNFEAAQARVVKGEAAKGAAASMVAEVGQIPDAIAATVAENPASVTAAIDTQPINIQAAVAALPTEALVSSQLETLLGGLESGQIPTWARPAVDIVESRLAERGMAVSTVARDSLFNAIIQNAVPIAQANAQALQERSAQNLANEQQATLQTAQLESSRRLQNLANQQTAASQTAQFAQNIQQLQSQFTQEAAVLTAQQAQQIRTQNLTNRQRTAEVNAQNQQATNSLNLSNEQQIELANLEVESLTGRENMSATNQQRLAEFQVAADFINKNAAFKQQMELANLDANQQVRLANLTALNNASSDNLSAAQQTELANLNSRMETNLAQASIAQAMGIAQLNVNQQRAVENARLVANIDLTKFNADQQVQLANSQFMQTVTLSDFNARQQAAMQNATALASLDLATVDQRTRVAIENANNFLQLDIANLSNQQQAVILDQQSKQQRLLSDQSAQNAARQFNAQTETQIAQFNTNLAAQMEQFNVSQQNAMAQFNVTEKNRTAAINSGNQIDVEKFNNQLTTQLDQFNAQLDSQREMWNAQNAQAIEQSNTEWRRQANTINTAAENAANATAAQQAYNITTQELANVWQQLRDDASYARTAFENEEQRKTTLYATALANDPGAAGEANYIDKLVGIADKILES
tara:strand:- start:8313 stop:11345 length:3033 start_codon:yes stop_codon:yes gene_type:complete